MTLALDAPTTPLAKGKGISLHEARDRVRHDDVNKWDVTQARGDLHFLNGYLTAGEALLLPSNWATGQLCNRLGIPAPYFRKCPAPLQDAQANHWLRHAPHRPGEQWLLRAKDSTLRAVLSERYSPLDNAVLLDELRPLLPSHYTVDWFGLSEECLHLRVVDPHRCQEILPDDALTVGIHLSNSEVGYRSVTVDALVYRLVCQNGLIRLVKGKSLLRQRHLYVSEHRFVGALAEAMENALRESEEFLAQLQRATNTPVPQIEEVMKRIGEKWHLSDETQKAAEQALKQEPTSQQETLWGLTNAYTAAAQRLPDEARYDLETLAGNLAAHGVSAYAPRRKRETGSDEGATDVSNEQRRVAPETEQTTLAEPDIVNGDIVELAREMFEAEVVGRLPHEVIHETANGSSNGRHS